MADDGRFVHLHNHSQFSLLDGAQKLEEMVEQAVLGVEMKMDELRLAHSHSIVEGGLLLTS